MDLAKLVRDVPDFPVKGVLFKDITTLLKDSDAFGVAVDDLVDLVEKNIEDDIEVVAAIESRGFIFGAPLAYELHAGFVPIRKPGKLPSSKISASYTLEYGTNTLEIHKDAIQRGQKVLIVDDLLATGGSAKAAAQLVERLGGRVVGMAFLIELEFLKGMDKLSDYKVYSLLKY
jgi:adenine phosphoribosyltransferase